MLKVPVLLSQRDPRWSSVILGYNTGNPYNLGLYGCLLTCFGMYIGSQPNTINALLKEKNGFAANTGNFIWSKCTELGLRQIGLSERWEGPVSDAGIQNAKSYLDQGYPLLAEIDFNPNTEGEEMHFVLIIGYSGDKFFAVDPWTGQVINLDVYGGIRRTLIQYRVYDKKLPPEMPAPISEPQTILYEQVVIDAYKGMTDEFPTDDEKQYRLAAHLTVDRLIESLSGDSRFYTKYILPAISDYVKMQNDAKQPEVEPTNPPVEEPTAPVQPTPEPPRENPETPVNPTPTPTTDISGIKQFLQGILAYIDSLLPKTKPNN